MLVALNYMVEQNQSCLMHHSMLKKTQSIWSNNLYNSSKSKLTCTRSPIPSSCSTAGTRANISRTVLSPTAMVSLPHRSVMKLLQIALITGTRSSGGTSS